jgi:glucose/arabinose dehydrogenase
MHKDHMKTFFILGYCILMLCCNAQQLPPSIKMTPAKKIKLVPVKLIVPEQFKDKIHGGHVLNIPEGYSAQVFYAGRLDKPRFFAWGPDSVLYVANKNSGEIIALPDKNHDGIADTAIVAASGFHLSHDLAFYNGAMYVAEERRIMKCTDKNHDGLYETKEVFIDNIAAGARQPGGGHDTRTIVFDPAKKKMYLSIGSSCNVCRDQEYRAVIEEYNDDGTGRRPFATGIRNAVGMTLHNGRLWADNNGSDWQGDNIPPEWVDIVRDGGFYGHPFAYANGVYFDFHAHQEYTDLLPLTAEDSALVRSMVQPAALVQAHSAPMAIEFSNSSFPTQFRNGAFIAYRGSWNRSHLTGYKVVFLKFLSDQDTTAEYVTDVVTGFQPTESSSREFVWGRPVGLAVDQRGNLFVGSDDITQFIAIISPVSSKK